MKTISQFLADRRREERGARIARASGTILVASLAVIGLLVFGAALVKTAGIVGDMQGRAFCEGEVCAGPSW